MFIDQKLERIRVLSKEYGRYAELAKKAGVNKHWLPKFAQGAIKNPTIGNVSRLERFFYNDESLADDRRD